MSGQRESKLSIWTVCRFPADFPGKYTARRHYVDGTGSWPTTEVIVADDLQSIRAAMADMGLVCFVRDKSDDPVIVESWL